MAAGVLMRTKLMGRLSLLHGSPPYDAADHNDPKAVMQHGCGWSNTLLVHNYVVDV